MERNHTVYTHEIYRCDSDASADGKRRSGYNLAVKTRDPLNHLKKTERHEGDLCFTVLLAFEGSSKRLYIVRCLPSKHC